MAWRVLSAVIGLGLIVVYAIGSGRWVATGSSWYLSLTQPAWQPPPPVFGLAWTYNFLALAVVGVTMSLIAAPGRVVVFLVALAVSIGLALGWAYAFYVPHSLTLAAVLLTGAALVTIVPVAAAFSERVWLGLLLVPYLLWLAIATSLSWGYVALAR